MAEKEKRERKVFIKASVDEVEGTLVDVVQDARGNYRLVFESGETIVMPGSWSVPFEVCEGQVLHAKWEGGRFSLDLVDDPWERMRLED